MAVYLIMRLYKVPAKNQVEATNRMAEAIRLRVENDYHIKDIVKSPGDERGKGKVVNLKPARGWRELLKKQLGF
jgi:hypothetical protein